MNDLELAQQALPEPDLAVDNGGVGCFYDRSMIAMFLAGMSKAREIDAKSPRLRGEQIVDLWQQSKGSKYEAWNEKFITFARIIEDAIRSQVKK
jgi:hypothetical protein